MSDLWPPHPLFFLLHWCQNKENLKKRGGGMKRVLGVLLKPKCAQQLVCDPRFRGPWQDNNRETYNTLQRLYRRAKEKRQLCAALAFTRSGFWKWKVWLYAVGCRAFARCSPTHSYTCMHSSEWLDWHQAKVTKQRSKGIRAMFPLTNQARTVSFLPGF